ncbi:hypothetical protein QBC43DRAFT_356163 [Cladorrhinum sp. PSN259]|nr:hypothetical protein QBC43DRAFT_356163 [Cladorrhinum sp. PSN259]
MHRFLQASGALVLLVFATPSHCFSWKNNIHFPTCYANFVSNIPQNCSDNRQVCVNDTFGDLTHPGQIYITYDTCLSECGDGFGLWDIKDVLLRVSLWVIPAIVLIAHYHFPPLGAFNMICSVAHIVADPIDTLWCLLTRITVRQKLLKKATEWNLLSAGAIATIWSTYDEFGFQDPSDDFKTALDGLRTVYGYSNNFLAVKHGQRPDRKITAISLEPKLTLGQRLKALFAYRRQLPEHALMEQAQRVIQDLSIDERQILYHIELTAQRLVFNREESLLPTWISILGLMSAMMGAFVRTWSERLNSQTAHTIATVTLLLVIVPIVKLSGNLGAFTSSTAPIDIINTLRKDLETELFPEVAALFPPFRNIPSPQQQQTAGPYAPIPSQEALIPLTSLPISKQPDTDNLPPGQFFPNQRALLLLNWPPIAPYKGLNNCYRPFKTLPSSASNSLPPYWVSLLPLPSLVINWICSIYHHRQPICLLLVSAIWILVFCYLPALLISYLTPLRGFACRSLAWTVIATCWLFTLFTSLLISFLQHPKLVLFIPGYSRRYGHAALPISSLRAWRITWFRDFIISAFIGTVVAAQQLGLYNSCYCRSGKLSGVNPSYINLNPLTDEQFIEGWKLWVPTPGAAFLVSLVGILIIERWLFKESGQLFARGRKGREEMLVWVGCLEAPKEGSSSRVGYVDGGEAGRVHVP